MLACMLLVFLSLVEYAIILRKIVIHQRNLEKWRQEQIKEKKPDQSSEVISQIFSFVFKREENILLQQPGSLALLLHKEDENGEIRTKVTTTEIKPTQRIAVFEVAGSKKVHKTCLLRFQCRTELK